MSNARDPFLLLKESIGSLMYLWCRLDDALSDALHNGLGAPRRKVGESFHDRLLWLKTIAESEFAADPSRAATLTDLLTRLDEARRQRNLIVHSLSGVCADPKRGEPHLTCQMNEGNGRTAVRITQTALTALLDDMDRCRLLLEDVGAWVRLSRRRR